MGKTQIYQKHKNYKKDRDFGEKYENLLLDYCNKNEYKDTPLKKFKYQYSWYDFRNDTDCNELKTRRIFYNSYPDLMVGANKMRQAESKKHGLKYRFFFIMRDGTYYWDFTPNTETEEYYHYGVGGRKDRGCVEECKVAYIYTKYLKKYADLNCNEDC